MSASTGAITVRGSSRGGSLRWAILAMVVVAAIGAGTFLGRAIATNPPQSVRVIERTVTEGVETLPSDARDMASVKAAYGRLMLGTSFSRPAVPPTPTNTVNRPAFQYGHQLAP